MDTKEVAYSFKGSDASGYAVSGQGVHDNLNGNVNYPSCVPFLGSLQSNINLLTAAITAGGSTPTPAQTGATHAALKELKRTLKVINALVNWDANGNEAILLTSGFNLKTIAPKSSKSFIAKQGKLSGTVYLEINSYGIAAYAWEMSTDPISTWTPVGLTTLSKTIVTGLTPGVKYWFRVSVTKGKGIAAVSDPYTIMVI